jgi:N-acetylglucosamine kinase-like BadF-type ATPase
MLGDEASGAYFGKKLLQAYFYRELPHELSARLQHEYQVQKEEVLHQVYHQPNPNRYVASFMPFINQHSHHHYIRSLLADGFNEFIVKFVLKYEGCRQLPVHFTGSVAFLNKEILITALQQHALHAGNIIKSPVEGLVSYHLHITV